MAEDLVFYTHPMSRGRIARWMLEEVATPYRTELLDYGTTMKAPAYLAVNPMGKVPAIRHGGIVITECAAICAYLADAFPRAGLAPAPSDPNRGAYYRWLFFAAGPIEAAVTAKALGFIVPPDKKGMAGFGSLDDVVGTLEAHLRGKQFVAGDRFTAADVYLGSQIGWGLQFGTIERRPAFESYWAGISARPAAKRAREIDDKILAERQPRA